MRAWILLCLSLFLSSQARASSFVGNGGGAGDVELQIAIRELRETSRAIVDGKDEGLCGCSEATRENSLCEFTKRLNDEQLKFCSRVLKESAGDLARLAGESSPVKIGWTHEPLTAVENGNPRAVDAVTEPGAKRVTIHLERFLSLPPLHRLFLVAHEHLHFLKTQNKPLVDDGPIGPFKGPDGGRQLINAVAASLATTAYDVGVWDHDAPALFRSKGYKNRWIDLSWAGLKLDGDSSLSLANVTGSAIGARYYWDHIGVGAQIFSGRSEEGRLNQIHIDERRQSWSVGASYRVFPFDDPLTFLGQSHAVFGLRYVHISGDYKINDSFVESMDSVSASGLGLDCQYYIPFRGGFWGFASLGYLHAALDYKNSGVSYRPSVTTTGLGVSYGF